MQSKNRLQAVEAAIACSLPFNWGPFKNQKPQETPRSTRAISIGPSSEGFPHFPSTQIMMGFLLGRCMYRHALAILEARAGARAS